MIRKLIAGVLPGALILTATPALAGEAELWANFDARITGILTEMDGGIAAANAHSRAQLANRPADDGRWDFMRPDGSKKNEMKPVPADEARRQRVKGYCDGVNRDSMGRFGPILPGWARPIMTTCGIIDEVASNSYFEHWGGWFGGKKFENNCKTLESDAKSFMKAGPVPARPEVQQKAQHLGQDMYFYWQAVCKRKTKNLQINPFHPEAYN